ncbi:uncharacterized protein SEPMUDRAFT_54295 [Sphaerulina musiva SO2202]|uniref:Uncharacterized protein n=1 Tax=Sphaerulina musiva (strain SO2202) TaxID=692275 RepID=M3CWZ3_SPHMS|nr:uncharacterized protein SEPMUDRAFT_54295 [Sphaerulina musiva SO2202]EMF08642.1 hypothetical protein SEPMUDRAFT_54295 [Sphaerulina musiva SO2202]
MCYINMITWVQCEHFRVVTQMCAEAQRRQPAQFCKTAHEPIATDVTADRGPCPDKKRHPSAVYDSTSVAWAQSLGITSTSERKMRRRG